MDLIHRANMTHQEAYEIGIDRIPVIDIQSLFGASPRFEVVAAELLDAVTHVGFFYVKGHCIDESLMTMAFDESRRFFALPAADRDAVRVSGYHRGLLVQGVARMEGQPHADLKESYIWGVDFPPDNHEFASGNELLAPNRWPAAMPEMRDVLVRYLDQAHRCGTQLLRAIATSLDLELDYFVGKFRQPVTRASLIHYPPQPPTGADGMFGVSPHTDYGTMTLLAQDDVGGLRVRDIDGRWVAAPPIPGTLVVNVGDLLARWSNDRFRSTPHAVVNDSGRERYSIAVFLDPDWDTLIRPAVKPGEAAHYEDVLCGEYIRERFDRSFSYRGKSGSAQGRAS